jgi:hypothetical protein
MSNSFSERHGIQEPEIPITVRADAPIQFRNILWTLALKAGANIPRLADVILSKIFYPNYNAQIPLALLAQDALSTCPWNEVYDAAEHIYTCLKQFGDASQFERDMNTYLRRSGIGWQMIDGIIETRGSDSLESTIHAAADAMRDSGRLTAEGELREAMRDLSRRPRPDLTGAVQHAGAALECVARDVTGSPSKTFGEILKASPNMFPKPLDEGAAKFWGFVSNFGRHIQEGRVPTIDEALLVVGIAGVLTAYLTTSSNSAKTS